MSREPLRHAAAIVARQVCRNLGLNHRPIMEPLEDRRLLAGDGLLAHYYDNADFSDLRVTRVDPTVHFTWGAGSPDPAIAADTFCARWTGQIEAPYSQTYTFSIKSNEGARLWIDDQLVIDTWAQPNISEGSGTINLVAGQRYDIRLEHFENLNSAEIHLYWSSPSIAKQIIPQSRLYSNGYGGVSFGTGTGLAAEYFDNMDFGGTHIRRVDPTVNFNWVAGSPHEAIGPDTFACRWMGQVQAQYSETYTFHLKSNDGARLWIDDHLVVATWAMPNVSEGSGQITLQAGRRYNLRLESFENLSSAEAHLSWSSLSTPRQIIPQSQLYSTGYTGVSFGSGTGLWADYFDDTALSQWRVSRLEPTVNFRWVSGSPDPSVSADTFSGRWTGQLEAQYSELYTFRLKSNEGARLWIDDQLVIDTWSQRNLVEGIGSIRLTAGHKHDIRIEHVEYYSSAEIHLYWSSLSTPEQIIPQSQLYAFDAPPGNLTATRATENKVNLEWTDNTSNETQFYIYRWQTGQSPQFLAAVAANVREYQDHTAQAGHGYFYQVRALLPGGLSEPSGTAEVPAEPNAPVETLLETIRITPGVGVSRILPLDGSSVSSVMTLLAGQRYRIEAEGMCYIGAPADGLADAEYGNFAGPLNHSATGVDYGIGIDDVTIDGDKSPFWGQYDASHRYRITVTGQGRPISFNYHDDYPQDNRPLTLIDPAYGEIPLTLRIYRVWETPAVPTNLVATRLSETRVRLRWQDQSADETGFAIYRATDSGNFPTVPLARVDANVTEFIDNYAPDAYRYRYIVKAWSDAGYSLASNEAAVDAQVLIPPTTTDLRAMPSYRFVQLYWTDVADNDGYYVYQSRDGSNWTLAGEAGPDQDRLGVTGLQGDTRYYFRVAPFNQHGEGDFVQTSAVTWRPLPAAPSDFLTSSAWPFEEETFSWIDNAHNEQGFGLAIEWEYWRDDLVRHQLRQQVNLDASSGTGERVSTAVDVPDACRQAALQGGGWTFAWKVWSFNASGRSDEQAPAAAINLTATAQSDTSVLLRWEDRSGHAGGGSWYSQEDGPYNAEDGYRIEYSEDGLHWSQMDYTGRVSGGGVQDAPIVPHAGGPNTAGSQGECLLEGLKAGVDYEFRVIAFNAAGDAVSDSVGASTLVAPTGVSAYAPNECEINVTWADPSNMEDGFVIELCRQTEDGTTAWVEAGRTIANACHYTITGLVASSEYRVRVRTFKEAVVSAASPPEGVRVLMPSATATLAQATPDVMSPTPESFGEDFAAGTYEVFVMDGSMRFYVPEVNRWGVRGTVIVHSGGSKTSNGPGGMSEYATAGEAAEAYKGASAVFEHEGGSISIYQDDNPHSDNGGSVTYGLRRINAPLVSVRMSETEGVAREGMQGLRFIFSRSGQTSSALSVDFTLSGEAEPGDDYSLAGQSLEGYAKVYHVSIPAGQKETSVLLTALEDELEEGEESVRLSLRGHAAYRLGEQRVAQGRILAAGPDLDIDSNNDGQIDADNAGGDDPIEDDASKPGKIVAVNDDDSDGDGIPDWADGFNWRTEDEIVWPDAADDDLSANDSFVPLELRIAGNGENATIRFDYDANDPLDGIDLSEQGVYSLTDGGRMRLWLKPANAARDPRPFEEGGDWVRPGTFYTAGELDVEDGATLWAEVLAPSASLGDLTIAVEVDEDGDGPGEEVCDQVRLTGFRTGLYALGATGDFSPIAAPELSNPVPQFQQTILRADNLRLNDDNTLVLADISFSGMLDDAVSDLIEGSAGRIGQVTLCLNGQPLLVANTDVSKAGEGTSILHPYDFSATFSGVLTGVVLAPGSNVFELRATNPYGLSGYVQQVIELDVQAPSPQTYEYELRITDDPYADPSSTVDIEFRTRGVDGAWGPWRVLSRQSANVFAEADPDNGTSVQLWLDHALVGPQAQPLWSAVTDPATENKGESIALEHDRTEVVDGVVREVYKGEWTREDHDLEDLSRHQISLAPPSPATQTTAGTYSPFSIGIDGPVELGDFLKKAELDGSTYDVIRVEDQLLLAVEGRSLPRSFLATANLKLAAVPSLPADSELTFSRAWDFSKGFVGGLFQTVPDTVVGLWDGVKMLSGFVGRHAVSYLPPVIAYRYATEGTFFTVEDRRNWETAKGVASKAAQIGLKLGTDGVEFIQALQAGDEQTLRELGTEYARAFEFAAELLESIWASFTNQSDYEKGRIVGRIIGEVVLQVASSGAATAAKGATMSAVVGRLRGVKFLQGFGTKLDELAVFYTKLDELTEGIENLGKLAGESRDGRMISQRIAQMVLNHQRKTGAGAWESFEAYLEMTKTTSRRAVLDARLGFAVDQVMKMAYEEAADLIGAGKIEEGLAKVPSYNRVKTVMMGRRAAADLEAHHTLTIKWSTVLNIPPNKINDMPALVLNKYWHNRYRTALADNVAFHRILDEEIVGLDQIDRQSIVGALERAYKRFYGLGIGDPPPDVWIVTKKWLEENAVQP